MAFPYGRHENYSPLDSDGRAIYESPQIIQDHWNNHSHDGDMSSPPLGMASPPIEMESAHRMHRQSANSMHSMASQASLFPNPNKSTSYSSLSGTAVESESFLHDPMNKLDTHTFPVGEFEVYKDNTGKQLLHLILGCTARWLITLLLCACYAFVVKIWISKGSDGRAISETSKRWFNTVTSAVSLALGLNVASAFKDLALYMRWPILAARKRNLRELDLILNADSLSKLFHLVFITARPWVIISCLLWLFINILAQAGIAAVSLTYGFDVNADAVTLSPGNITIPDMQHFYPTGQTNVTEFNGFDEQYTAHVYGSFAVEYGIDDNKNQPKAGEIYKDSNAMLWWDDNSNSLDMVFSDYGAQSGNSIQTTYGVYTERTVTVNYDCEAHSVTANGTGTSNYIEVANIGTVQVDTVLPNSTVYFTNLDNLCDDAGRCSIVEVFEVSDTDPWYYKCNITMGSTQNDPRNLSYISNDMAYIATSSIAQVGYTVDYQQYYIYPKNSPWGDPAGGAKDKIGFRTAAYALGSIAGASLSNPAIFYEGPSAPSQAFSLTLGHAVFFYLILALIVASHFIFVVVVAILANRVKVGPDAYLSMSLLLRPIAEGLEGASNGRENSKAYKDAKKNTHVRYEKARNGRWILATST